MLPYLAHSGLSVFAEEAFVFEYAAGDGCSDFYAVMKASGLKPHNKLFAMRNGIRGRGIKIGQFVRLALYRTGNPSTWRVGGKRESCRIPAALPLTDDVLRLFGYYVAEGNCQDRYFILANRHPVLRRRIEGSLTSLGMHFHVRQSSDYSVASKALTTLLGKSCGENAAAKRLPDFWPQLADAALGILLRAYFDGDATVTRNGEVIATTASRSLASDLAYALKRFGIHALRPRRKRATNSAHAGGVYFDVCISGGEDVRRYADFVGFDHTEKAERLRAALERGTDTNVDIVPIKPESLSALRKGVGLTMAALGAASGVRHSAISLIESGRRSPSRRLLKQLLDVLGIEANKQRVADIGWRRTWQLLDSLSRVRWTPVKDVRPASYPHPYVYDLSVPGPETFLAGHGGAIVHNTYTIANVIQQVQRPTLVMVHNKTLAAQLYGEFKEYFPQNSVEYFVSYYDYYQPEAYVPSSDTFIEKDASVNEHIEQMRLSATKALLERPDAIIVATVSGSTAWATERVPEHGAAPRARRPHRPAQAAAPARRHAVHAQRARPDPGHDRVRGDVIDIFPAESEREAVRVELFDDEIEALSYFDPLTGEVLRKVPRLTVYPSSHYVTRRERVDSAIAGIRDELRERLLELRANDKLLEAQRLEQRTTFDLEMMMEVGYCSGIENYSRYLSCGCTAGEPPPCLFDYLPDNALLVVDESQVTGAADRRHVSRRSVTQGDAGGIRVPTAVGLDNRPLRFEDGRGRAADDFRVGHAGAL